MLAWRDRKRRKCRTLVQGMRERRRAACGVRRAACASRGPGVPAASHCPAGTSPSQLAPPLACCSCAPRAPAWPRTPSRARTRANARGWWRVARRAAAATRDSAPPRSWAWERALQRRAACAPPTAQRKGPRPVRAIARAMLGWRRQRGRRANRASPDEA